MAEKLSAADGRRLEQALATYESWRGGPERLPSVVERLGGDSNLSFLIGDGLGRWVLRLNHLETDVGINRENERLAMEAAYGVGISPGLVFHDAEFLVTPFVEGKRATLGDLAEIGGLFSRIHGLDVELVPRDPLLHLKSYLDRLEPDALLEDCYRRVVELYPAGEVELRPCHSDCLLPNIIRSGKGLQVIDWEYAAGVDPAFDLGVFCGAYGLDEGQRGVLLDGYGYRAGEDDGFEERVGYFEIYYGLLEVLWWRFRGKGMERELWGLVVGLGL